MIAGRKISLIQSVFESCGLIASGMSFSFIGCSCFIIYLDIFIRIGHMRQVAVRLETAIKIIAE